MKDYKQLEKEQEEIKKKERKNEVKKWFIINVIIFLIGFCVGCIFTYEGFYRKSIENPNSSVNLAEKKTITEGVTKNN